VVYTPRFANLRDGPTAVYQDPRYTFERGVRQKNEIQPQQFYIESPPVCCAVRNLFDARLDKCKTDTR
jgi:hypothetical protein